MGIKDLKPTKKSRTKQGYFNISESQKYIGKIKKVIYRSSWEYIFCVWCERNPLVQYWSSESIEIKYECPLENRIKNYYPDFFIKLTNGKTYLVEIKPSKEYTSLPEIPNRKTKKAIENYNYLRNAYLVNMSKFKSAKKYCESKNWGFMILDEYWFKKNK